MQEQLRKKVVKFGNGSIVYTPKDWIGREVIVTLPKLSIKEELFKLLDPYLLHIQGIYLYGSFTRNEQEQDSDIDVLVIADKKFKIESKRFDINVHSFESLKKILKDNPIYLLIIKEARTILNGSLLEELKNFKLSNPDFSFILDTTRNLLEINKDFIDIEKEMQTENFDNPAVIYSLVLRLRGLYMIDCILKNKSYLNKNFKRFAVKIGIKNFNLLYKIYRYERDNKKLDKTHVSMEDINRLYLLVKNETEKKSAKINR